MAMMISSILDFISRAGKWSFFIAIIVVASEHWGILNVSHLPATLIDALYVFILINGLALSPFLYLEKRARSTKKSCPKCGEPLEQLVEYRCPQCGRLHFEK